MEIFAMPNLIISRHLLSQMPFISSQTYKKPFAKGKFSSEAKIAIKFSLATTSCTVRTQYIQNRRSQKKFLTQLELELIYEVCFYYVKLKIFSIQLRRQLQCMFYMPGINEYKKRLASTSTSQRTKKIIDFILFYRRTTIVMQQCRK